MAPSVTGPSVIAPSVVPTTSMTSLMLLGSTFDDALLQTPSGFAFGSESQSPHVVSPNV
jgi:hypothetical protein